MEGKCRSHCRWDYISHHWLLSRHWKSWYSLADFCLRGSRRHISFPYRLYYVPTPERLHGLCDLRWRRAVNTGNISLERMDDVLTFVSFFSCIARSNFCNNGEKQHDRARKKQGMYQIGNLIFQNLIFLFYDVHLMTVCRNWAVDVDDALNIDILRILS